MCGIVGLIGNDIEFVKQSLKLQQARGYDSWGIVAFTPKHINVQKSLQKKIEFNENTEKAISILGHTRWSTSSPPSIESAHPHNNGKYWSVHNGIIHDVKFNCDSKYITYTIDNSPSLMDGLYEVIKKAPLGAFLVVDKTNPNIIYAYRDNLPLYVNSSGTKIVSECSALDEDKAYLLSPGIIHMLPNFAYEKEIEVEKMTEPTTMRDEILQQKDLIKKNYDLNLDISEPFVFFGCGSSFNVALIADKLFNSRGIPASSIYATEIKDRINYNKFVGFSQSGETKDILDAVNFLKRFKKDVIVITNNPNSTVSSMCDIFNINVGTEYGVASTKTMTCMIKALMNWLRIRHSTELSDDIEEKTRELAKQIKDYKHILCFGSRIYHPVAMEYALKIKEVSYIHSEGLPASELKHGPIALIDDSTLSIFIGQHTKELLANMNEIKSRGGKIVSISDTKSDIADYNLVINSNMYEYIITGQWLAWNLGTLKGLDVDKPRNLAKSVTV